MSIPISGHDLEEVKEKARNIREWVLWDEFGLEKGWHRPDVITPFDVCHEPDKPYSYYMGKDIEALLECELPSPLHHPIIFFACRSLIVQSFSLSRFVKRFLILSNSCSRSFVSCSLSFGISLSSILPAYLANNRGFRFIISFSF